MSEICRTLKCCNFFVIGSILKILDVSESFGSLLSHCCTYFPEPLRETTSKVANPMPVSLGAARRAVGLDQISKDFELELLCFQRESSHITSDISKMKDIHFKKIGYVFSTYLLQRMRCGTSRMRHRRMCTKSLATLTSLPQTDFPVLTNTFPYQGSIIMEDV